MSASKGCGFQGSKQLGKESTHKNLAWFREVSESGDFFSWRRWYGRALKYVSAVNQRRDNSWGWLMSVWLLMGWRKNVNLTSATTWKLLVFGFLGFPLLIGVRSFCIWHTLAPVALGRYPYCPLTACSGLLLGKPNHTEHQRSGLTCVQVSVSPRRHHSPHGMSCAPTVEPCIALIPWGPEGLSSPAEPSHPLGFPKERHKVQAQSVTTWHLHTPAGQARSHTLSEDHYQHQEGI